MDNQLLTGSLVINVLLIIERILSKTKKSKCLGAEIEMSQTIQKSKSELNINSIVIDNNESLSTTTSKQNNTLDIGNGEIKSI